MKLVTKIALIATLASFMFAGVNLTWGNTFVNNTYAMDDNVTPDNDVPTIPNATIYQGDDLFPR